MDARVVAAQQFLEFVAVFQIASFNDTFHLPTVKTEQLTDVTVTSEPSAAF